jgi:hypothetical protein
MHVQAASSPRSSGARAQRTCLVAATTSPLVGPSRAADVVAAHPPLRDTSNRRVGSLHSVFVRIRGRRQFVDHVSGTFVVEGGYIVVEGIADEPGRTDDMAIAGGTGRYAGARGTLRVTDTRRGARFRFSFIG